MTGYGICRLRKQGGRSCSVAKRNVQQQQQQRQLNVIAYRKVELNHSLYPTLASHSHRHTYSIQPNCFKL